MPETFDSITKKQSPQESLEKPYYSFFPEEIGSIESYLERILPEQYKSQVMTLTKLGLLELLPNSEAMGVVGIDGKEYPIPSIKQIQEAIYQNKELYETKINQGFTKLQLTPFAVPLERLTMKLEEQILKHHKEGKLFATKENPNDPNEPLVPLELDTSQPLYIYEKWINKEAPEGERGGDVTGDTIYYPKQFDKNNHGGLTKQELLDISSPPGETASPSGVPEVSRARGWNIILLEPNPNIPREGKGGSTGSPQAKRHQLEANKFPSDYLKLIQADPQYQGESGLTNEDWCIQFLTHLEQTNQVIDDYQGKGSANFLIGSYSKSVGAVPDGSWLRGDQQAGLRGDGPGDRYEADGCRGGVRIKI